MARKAKIVQPRRLYIPKVPANASWFESDSYDRRTWNEIVADAPSIADLAETGERLVPHFGALVQDLFFALFKMNPVFRKAGDVRLAAALNRTILEQIVPSAPFQALRSRTALEEDKAAIAAIVMSEHALEMMKSEKLINRGEMLDLWDLARQEQDLEARADAVKAVNEMKESQQGEPASGEQKKDQATKKELAEMADAAERAAKVSEARLNQKSRQFETQLKGADQSALKRMQLKTAELAGEIDQAAEDSHDFSREFGQGGRVAAGARLELGRRLARNKKLGELARMVGRFKQDARALKRKTLERGVAEAYDIELGSELGRLIPAELLAMHHPVLKRDFHRRVLEGTVLQYRLRDDEQQGKGPMVVCIDVSSSMQGDKEMWSKAVALTLMDIARRQRRLFRAVMFSSGDVSLKVLDLNRERRYAPDLNKVVEMAEYFPGGGTDFESPIDAAVELLGEKKLKRGDIVIITDGESQVSPDWLARLRGRKDELDFSIFAVLVDVGSAETSSLAQFADRITSVKRISDEHARDIFLHVQS
ncbi:MAG: VWA domain-containing protein [Candidatus Binatus sp.]